ncbi:apolipoprotein N-acyltransferase [Deefgea tanakiae]|uniref:Apolipoprotein N-acyltransferase n=1 Tax=Deefgea tanakiae TaxID=2865840 RepID=A0ABX8Z639_9NEIS|nr:apolipoprotein N-acyltransferase [Deefgea tanakiae]QZA76844.1 apolipoprotein N-acyltransferase [Deefgea tanakiae]
MTLNRPTALLLQFLSGTAAVTAFAPLSQAWVILISLWVLFYGWQQAGSARRALLPSFVWGLGYFIGNASWIYISLHTHGNMPAPLAGAAVFLFAAYLALFPMLAGWLTWRLPCPEKWRFTLLAPTLFLLTEWLRGWLFTGFPWASIGSAQIDWLGGLYPIIGTYGVGWLVALCVSVFLVDKRFAVGLAIAVLSTSSLLSQITWTQPMGEPVKVSVLQGNIQQSMKWNSAFYMQSLENYLKLTQQAKGQLILMPETAIPSFFKDIPAWYIEELRVAAAAKSATLLLGVATQGENPQHYYNSVVNLAQPEATPYGKSHLVPFGEYIPLPWLFGSIYKVLDMPLSGFQRAPLAQVPFDIVGGKVAANVCYEDVFGDEIRVNAANATLLANFTNMAWFDGSWAAEQHAQMARARALENGRYLIRATNTGKTAIINPKGQFVAMLAPEQTGILEGEVRHMQGTTPYQWAGDKPVIGLLFGILLAAGIVKRRKQSETN